MSSAKTAEQTDTDAPAKGGGKKKLLLLGIPVVLVAVVAGLWFGGVLPPLLGMGKAHEGAEHASEKHGEDKQHGAGEEAKGPPAAKAPVFVELPEMVANLNAGPRRNGFVKLKAKLELARAEDQPVVATAMPRLIDLFQTYLRDMRPEELRGAAGTYRLREELLARADIAVTPAHVVNVLFIEMLVQ